MQPQTVQHPSCDTLLAFGSGKLDETEAEAVVAHLERCPECCQKAGSLPGDSFLVRLRALQSSTGTPVPTKPLTGLAQTVTPADVPVPPELRGHPQYEILRQLGHGGMGVVYLAKNKLMDWLEVLKVLNQESLAYPGAGDRFLREIRAAARLSHPNIVTAHSALQIGELLVFAMEYIEGEDLSKAVKAHGPLPVATACFYTQQAALGLQHAFEKNTVHRDIKPQNLILARDGHKHVVKILDFGLAKAYREEGGTEHDLTGAGKMLGTPDYIAPEQMQDAATADIRADIYSLGCTLYYLLTGGPPFKAKSLFDLLHAHLTKEATPLNQLRGDILGELAAVVTKMMAKEPKERYQQPIEVARALTPFIKTSALEGSAQANEDVEASAGGLPQDGMGTLVPKHTVPNFASRWGGMLARAVRSRPQTHWLILAAVVSLIAVALWFGMKERDPLVQLRQKELERQVAILTAHPPVVIRGQPDNYRELDRLTPIDHSAYQILTDDRVTDLRMWKDVPPGKLHEFYGAVCSTRQLRLKKIKPTSAFVSEARTSGLDVCWKCLSPYPFHVFGQKGDVFVGQDRMKARQIEVDVSSVPVDTDFELHLEATYWNSLQTEREQWFGVIGYEGAFKISILILFSTEKPFKNFTLMTARTIRDQPSPYSGPKILLSGPEREWLYWEVPTPEAGRVYQLHWSW